MPTLSRQLCALVHDGLVLTDGAGHVPSYGEDEHTPLPELAAAAGDPGAVLVSPQLLVHEEPRTTLTVFAPRADPVPGTWTPLADLADDEEVAAALRSVAAVVAGRTGPPARRPDWFRTGWYDEVEAWVDTRLTARNRARSGPVEPVKVWSLSAVLRVPCAAGPPVWFKASCRHFHAEPALTRLVSAVLPGHAPPVVATDDDRAWTLMEDVAGADEHTERASPTLGPAAARIIAALQLRSREHLGQIEALGVPRRDLRRTLYQFDDVLADSAQLHLLTADELRAARATRDDVRAVLEQLAALGIPDTLVHGDLHIGNVAHADEEAAAVLYDWSDAAVSHPFLDVVHLTERLPDDEREAALRAYLEPWRAAYADVDVDRALQLAVPADTIYQTVTFEQIHRAQEDASHWEMYGVVARFLRALPERFPQRR